MNVIIFENKNLIACDKPAGILSVPSRFSNNDNRKVLADIVKPMQRGSLFPVHRLDQEVSGLVVFAKNIVTQRLLSGIFESRKVEKKYVAWSEVNTDKKPEFNKNLKWEDHLVRGKKRTFEAPYGKIAITNAVAEGEGTWHGKPYVSWDLHPLTGRPHQLRFHLYKAGYPILGDVKYGSKTSFLPGAIGLRALNLRFMDTEATEKLEIPNELSVVGPKSYWQESLG